MRLRRCVAIPGFLVSIAFAGWAGAQDSAVVVWYRASDECPAGPAFLGKLADVASRARLADAGDHIDFVVTLVAGHGATVGRLERQTQSGTVAIRELRDVSCERVADALALSLGLALGPAQTTQPAATQPNAPAAPAPASSAAPEPSADAAPISPAVARPAPVVAATVAPPVGIRRASAPPFGRPRWSVGLDGGALFGVTPSALGRATVFADVDHLLPRLAEDLSFRFGLVGAFGSPSTAVGPVQQWILAGRGEVCPWRWGGRAFGLEPCAAFELGATGASEKSDARASRERATSVWAAPGVGLRASVSLTAAFALELGGDASVPLSRNEVDAGSTRLYRSEFIAINAYLGVSFGPF